MVQLIHGLALLAGISILTAGIWVSQIRQELPSPNTQSDRGDPAVLSLVTDPFTSVEDTAQRLNELERLFRERQDRRAVFLTVYARVTEEVANGIEQNTFENPEWVAEYLVTFADFYRRALLDYETGDTESLPTAWQLFFRATAADALVVQSAVLGINAHVNYDLALALREVGIEQNRASKYRDHRRINETLWRLVDETLTRLGRRYAPGLVTVSRLAGPLGKWAWFLALAAGREGAWWIAVVLTDSRRESFQRTTQWVMDRFSTVVAYVLLGPNGHSFLLHTLRKVEQLPAER